MSSRHIITVAQAAPVAFDCMRTLEKMPTDASRRSAKLVVFPEAFVLAYPKGPSFGDTRARPNFDGEATLAAGIDRSARARGQYDLDVTGHHARPNMFRRAVDERRKSPELTLSNGALDEQANGGLQ